MIDSITEAKLKDIRQRFENDLDDLFRPVFKKEAEGSKPVDRYQQLNLLLDLYDGMDELNHIVIQTTLKDIEKELDKSGHSIDNVE